MLTIHVKGRKKLEGVAEKGRTSQLVHPAASLTEQVTDVLSEQITGGGYAKGEALPSEQSMAISFGVSRTVIREAISRLKAEGLVLTRQGRGAFVASKQRTQPFQISAREIGDPMVVFQLVELRMGFETEAVTLAAQRRNRKHLREMKGALTAMQRAIDRGEVDVGVEADLRFHRAICEATGNPYFVRFFNFLAQFLQEAISVSRKHSAHTSGIGTQAQAEHEAVYNAIAAQDPEGARVAARRHVANTARRLTNGAVNLTKAGRS